MHPIIKKNKKAIILMAQKYGAHKVRVFGSMARNNTTLKSDVDFLVEFDKDTSLLNQIELICELEKLLHRKIDITTEQTLHWYLKDKILKEAIPL